MPTKQDIGKKKLFIFDLDGTIYLSGVLFPESLPLLKHIVASGKQYHVFSNNSSRSTDSYLKKIRKAGIPCDHSSVATSTQVLIGYIKDNYIDKTFYVMGTKGMRKEMAKAGIPVRERYAGDIDGVVISYDTELNYQKLIDVTKLLNEGKIYLATNPDYVCPVDYGFIPDCGTYAIMLEYATKRTPKVLGKPSVEIIDHILKKTGCTKEETVMVGDRLYTDILCGNNAGVDTILVLSGETKKEDLEKSLIRPTFVMEGIGELYKLLKEKDGE